MFAYRTPGTYFEWLDKRPSMQTRLRSDIVGFVGIAARGPLHRPIKVESWTQFSSIFGSHIAQGYLAYAVEGFFANGGRTSYVVRVADPETALPATLCLQDGRQTVRLAAISPGVWGQAITVMTIDMGDGRFTLRLYLENNEQETWFNVSLNPDDETYIKRLLNDSQSGSRLVTVRDRPPDDGWLATGSCLRFSEKRVVAGRLTGGADGLSRLTPDHFVGRGNLPDITDPSGAQVKRDQAWGLRALELIDEISMVAIPDIMVPMPVSVHPPKAPPLRCHGFNEQPVPSPLPKPETEYAPGFNPSQIRYLQDELIRHCEELKDRMAILDTWLDDQTPSDALSRRNTFDTKYGALYYPWLLVPDPLQLTGLLRPVPPSGHVAGIYARVANEVGVHKPPANEVVQAIKDVRMLVDDIDHGHLNSKGINVVRRHQGRGLRLVGARTLSSDSEWRYVNVRRLLMMIEESLHEKLQWTVFEPSNPDLWRDIDRVVRSFLDNLWRQGMLDGTTATEAYQVTCDATTNPPAQIDQSRITCEIGIRPPWPAEFVVIRIGRTENGLAIVEG